MSEQHTTTYGRVFGAQIRDAQPGDIVIDSQGRYQVGAAEQVLTGVRVTTTDGETFTVGHLANIEVYRPDAPASLAESI